MEEHVLPIDGVGFARCHRQAPGLGTTDAKLLLLLVLQPGAATAVVWAHARAQNLCLYPLGRGYKHVKVHNRLLRP